MRNELKVCSEREFRQNLVIQASDKKKRVTSHRTALSKTKGKRTNKPNFEFD